MYRIAMIWEDGCKQVAAFAHERDAAEHLSWMHVRAILFKPASVRYVRGVNGRFISRKALGV